LKRKTGILLLTFLLLVGGGCLAFEGLKIDIKAKVGQILLNRAWENTLETGKEQRPWSGFDGSLVFRLTVPKYKVDQVVLKGISGQNLAWGPSYHVESSLPQEKGATVISSHRDSHGIFIKNMQIGDVIELQDHHKNWHTYAVEDLFILDVNKENVALNPNDDRLLLVTCYPFEAVFSGTPLRYVVSAVKKPSEWRIASQ
jgi:sortase A